MKWKKGWGRGSVNAGGRIRQSLSGNARRCCALTISCPLQGSAGASCCPLDLADPQLFPTRELESQAAILRVQGTPRPRCPQSSNFSKEERGTRVLSAWLVSQLESSSQTSPGASAETMTVSSYNPSLEFWPPVGLPLLRHFLAKENLITFGFGFGLEAREGGGIAVRKYK